MATLQLASDQITGSLDGPRAAVVATRLAEVMGLYQRQPGTRIDRETVRDVINAAAAHGLAEHLAARISDQPIVDGDVFALLDILEQSPLPAEEIRSLATILGPAALHALVGTSEGSLRRYAAASRETPDVVAGRLHYLALLVAILRGSFNEFGIRRWFERPHPSLGGVAPATRLAGDFDPDARDAGDVLRAATGLLG